MTSIQTKTNAADFLLDGKEGDRVALYLLDRATTYGELEEASARIAAYLLQIGGRKGDRVILVSENSFFWVASYLGILRAGLICVPLPVHDLSQELTYYLEITEAKVAFIQADFALQHASCFRQFHLVTDRAVDVLPDCSSQKAFNDILSLSPLAIHSFDPPDPGGLATLMFTSGFTGRPRAVMISHANIVANTLSIIQSLQLAAEERIMTVLPFHYCFGASLLHTHLRVGGSLVIDLRFGYPEAILHRMLEMECTGFAGVPSHFQILLRASSLRKRRFPHLRHVQQAGGHLAPNFIRELRHALPDSLIFIMYGQTEATARLSCLPPEFLDTKLGSIGKGIPGVKLRVLNESGSDVRPHEVGEIVAEGNNVALGYWRAPEEMPATFRDGKLFTGDLATVDEDGFIYIVDRAKEFLKCGGVRISSRQLEDRLLQCEDLLEAAIVGVPDEILGEAVKAFIVPRNARGVNIQDHVREFCRHHFQPCFMPREVVVLQALPKNDAGKILKHKLKCA
jgi:long-chain acyl-CoA synthetase